MIINYTVVLYILLRQCTACDMSTLHIHIATAYHIAQDFMSVYVWHQSVGKKGWNGPLVCDDSQC